MLLQFPYGQEHLKIEIPNEEVDVLTSHHMDPISHLRETVTQRLKTPIHAQPLHLSFKKRKAVCIIVPDETRACPTRELLSPVLEQIQLCKPKNIVILIGNGLHREIHERELPDLLGEEVCEEYDVINHSADRDDQLIDLHVKTSYQTPGIVNKIAFESDYLLSIGLVEPHFFAGFSGGRKSVLPAIAGKQAIFNNHSYRMIDDPKASFGNLKGNPIHHDMLEFMAFVDLSLIINVTLNRQNQVTQVFIGNPIHAHQEAIKFLNQYVNVKVRNLADIVIVSNGGYPLDRDLYQTVKGMATGCKVVNEGGVIIMVGECRDGLGGHEHFVKLMQRNTLEEVLTDIKENEPIPDQWQTQLLVNILKKVHVIMVTSGVKEGVIEEMKLKKCSSLEEALRVARKLVSVKKPRILGIPEGPYVLPHL